jgi:ribonuclease HI
MSTEEASETKAVGEETSHHFVVYTDGGCRPSRGFGGYGFHGYLFQEDSPKQGSGARATPTADGYSDNKAGAVTVHKYVDLWSSIEGLTTNNVAELLAACEALEYSDQKNVKSVRVFVDSTYVRDGLTDWIVGWMANDWKKSNGEDVSNRDLWERLIKARAALEQKWVDVKIEWVKGHSGDLGNCQADLLATRGVILSKKGMDERRLIESEAKGYWNLKTEHNRMLSKSNWYFNTNAEGSFLSHDGRYVYHLGKHGNNDNMLGKRMSDASFSVVYTKEPDKVLEAIRHYQDQITDGTSNHVIIGRLDAIQQPKNYVDIEHNGSLHLDAPGKGLDLFTPEEVQITKQMRPARLAYHAIETLINLESILEELLVDGTEGPRIIRKTDITDYLYDFEEAKKGKIKQKLKKSIGTATRSIDVKAAYNIVKAEAEETITLVMDMDLPSRNTLSALADRQPKVYVITWRESDSSFRYATIVDCGDDIGIWSSVYSNLRLIKPSK